jgi:hypothetical protein
MMGHGIPSNRSSRERWKNFLKKTKNLFRRRYLMTSSKETKESIEKLYVNYDLIDIFSNTTALRKSPEKADYPKTIKSTFEISISDEVAAKYGSGLYLKLKLELVKSGDNYETLYLRVKAEENTDVVKVYHRLRKKIKKITGYQFNLSPVMIEGPKNSKFGNPSKIPMVMWVTELKLPPGLNKIQGTKTLIDKKGDYRYQLSTI